MNRDELRDTFSPLLDGELSPDERAEIESQLAQDAELLRELDSLKRVNDLYRSMPRAIAPDGFENDVRNRLHPERASERRRLRVLWPSLAAAALVLVGVTVVLFQYQRNDGARLAYEPTTLKKSDSSAPAADESAATAAVPKTQPETETAMADAQAPAGVQDGLDLKSIEGAETSSVERAPENVFGERAEASPSPAPAAAPTETQDAAPPPAESPAAPMAAQLQSLGYAQEDKQEEPRRAAKREARSDVVPGAPAPVAREAEQALPGLAFERMNEKDVAPSAGAAPKDAGGAAAKETMRTIANRKFELRDGALIQLGYNGEPTTELRRGSEAANELINREQELKSVFEVRESVVFKADSRWYKLEAQRG